MDQEGPDLVFQIEIGMGILVTITKKSNNLTARRSAKEFYFGADLVFSFQAIPMIRHYFHKT